MDLRPPFRGGSPLTRAVAFVDDGFVEEVSAEGDGEVGVWVVGVGERFEGWEGVDCCEHVLGWKDVRRDLGGDDETAAGHARCRWRRRRQR